MQTQNDVFEKTYINYLEQIKNISFNLIAPKLGANIINDTMIIQLFDTDYSISAEKIVDPSGKKPSYDICIILSKYLILCPDKLSKNKEWASFRDFKDSGPLANYFTNDIEHNLASYFSGKLGDLKTSSNKIGGYQPDLDVNYDFAVQFSALPMISILVLFNDKDDEFSAKCSVLFESRAEKFLDAECIAMLGWQMVTRLKKA
ncbi:MAG: DUF3786 domain-containing protein [Desulfobacteraceae bacterium]|nr:DUF3786 domain-containing protein [Desulfobacteraceae bacterium]